MRLDAARTRPDEWLDGDIRLLMDGRQKDLECRAVSHLRVDLDVPAVLLDRSVDHRQPEARSRSLTPSW